MMNTLRPAYRLMIRALRESIRQPAFELPNIFIPFFFFAVTVGAIGSVAGQAFGITNYTGFQMPVAILQAVAGTASNTSLAAVTDIERGYFDKLLLTPVPRLALVLGRMGADFVRAVILTTLVVVVGIIFGSGMEAGVLGAVVVVLIAASFGVAYSGISLAIALRTGSSQAAQAGFLLFFPLLFLSPAFAPKEVFSGWLEFLATINPVTYALEGQRYLILTGWSVESLAKAAGSVGGFAVVTVSMTLAALRWRTA